MKIRTDFVTNSSSSCFVRYIIGSEPFVDFLENMGMPKPELTPKGFIKLFNEGNPGSDELPYLFCYRYLEKEVSGLNNQWEISDIFCDIGRTEGTDVPYKEYQFTNLYDGTPESAARVLKELFTETNFLKCIDVYYKYYEIGGGEIDEPYMSVHCCDWLFAHKEYKYGRGFIFEQSEGLIEDYQMSIAITGNDSKAELQSVLEGMYTKLTCFSSDTELLIVGNEPNLTILNLAKMFDIPTISFSDFKNKLKWIDWKKSYIDTKSCEQIGKIVSDEITELDLVGINSIKEKAFVGCTNLQKITMYRGLNNIPNKAFANLTQLKKVIMSSSLTTISEEAFAGCVSLEELRLPFSIKYIKKNAFKNCKSLKRIIFEGIENGHKLEIHETAFEGCDKIEIIWDNSTFEKNECNEKQIDKCENIDPESLLINSLFSANTKEEMQRLLLDLCPIPTLKDLEKRLRIALMISNDQRSDKIIDLTGASTATIAKINKILKNGNEGFAYAFSQLYCLGYDFNFSKEESAVLEQAGMFKYPSMPWLQLLVDTFMSIKTAEAMKYLLYDLCVDSELKSMIQRIKAAEMLMKGLSVSEISKQTGISSSIIKKVDYAMHYLGTGGFQIVLERMN